MTKEQEVEQIRELTFYTILGYISRQIQGLSPRDNLDNSQPISLLDITIGQLLRYMLGFEVDTSTAQASEELKKQFDKSVLPLLPRMANEAVHRDEDFGRLSLNTLEQRAALLEKQHGSGWNETEEGARIADVLKTVYDHEYAGTIPFTKYKYIFFTTNEKYKKETSSVDWVFILDPASYA
ncbi:MAG: hypothetical protein ACQR33_01340 [Candidatus Saccharibacteria bacterium]